MSEKLFDYGKSLNVTTEQLGAMREIEVAPEQSSYLGTVYDENTQRNQQLYILDDEVVKLRPATGIES